MTQVTTDETAIDSRTPQYETIIIGGGVAGIYQLYKMQELGIHATLLELGSDLGGTWFWNRYPGARFDSESYTYGYSFSKELLEEWHWKERFSSQPENLKYLNYVVDKFDLRKHMQFNAQVTDARFDEEHNIWRLHLADGRDLSCRFLLGALGLLSAHTLPRIDGIDDFEGQAFHTYNWPREDVVLEGKRVAVIGTGATAVQLIPRVAERAEHLTVLQRRPNWCAPLNNSEISEQEMADIRARYDEIFETCARTPGGFEHEPDRRGFHDVPSQERRALYEKLYAEPGFGIWLANFRETMLDEEANAEITGFIAEKIRERVDDPILAEKLIPKDHGFGIQRVPMETGYYEAYNRDNVQLVDLQESPIECLTRTGIRTADGTEYEFDIIVFATGFDAMTGAYDRINIEGVGGQTLRDKWRDGPQTYFGMLVHGFPNMITIAGPQSGSASTNYPRGIEIGVDWGTDLLQYMWQNDHVRMEATAAAEERWVDHVRKMYDMVLIRKAKSWFTGYNSNVDGHDGTTIRHLVYNGGAPKFKRMIDEAAENNFDGIDFS